MERRFTNSAALRHQIVNSSPELRELESKLKACALSRYNKAAIAEKEVQMKIMNIGEKEYADLVKQMDHEEKLSVSLTLADQEVKMLETQRALKEQIDEKAANKAKAEAENVVEIMAELDESKLMEEEKKQQWKKRQEFQERTRLALEKQNHLKKLLQEEDRLQDKKNLRSAEEYNLKVELQKEMERQKMELQRLQHHQQEVTLVRKLEKQQMEKDVIQDTRLELEILEKNIQERKYAEEKEINKEKAKLSLLKGLDEQVQFKKELETLEQQKEAEYRKLLLEVMAEEGRLEQLVAGARKRRQQDHRQLVENLLQVRRALRARLMKQQLLENKEEKEYNQLRESILEEEEKQLLLKHAPHLMPYLTPELRARLKQLL